MRPDEYEYIVTQYFETKGYKTSVSQNTNDYGIDVFASKGKVKIAIQTKMFWVNRYRLGDEKDII